MSPRSAAILTRFYPRVRQQVFGEAAAAAVGFDFQRGRLDVTAHPFCSGIGPGDCRITTRYDEHNFSDAFFGILHEVGHGLYEQGLDHDHYGDADGRGRFTRRSRVTIASLGKRRRPAAVRSGATGSRSLAASSTRPSPTSRWTRSMPPSTTSPRH